MICAKGPVILATKDIGAHTHGREALAALTANAAAEAALAAATQVSLVITLTATGGRGGVANP